MRCSTTTRCGRMRARVQEGWTNKGALEAWNVVTAAAAGGCRAGEEGTGLEGGGGGALWGRGVQGNWRLGCCHVGRMG